MQLPYEIILGDIEDEYGFNNHKSNPVGHIQMEVKLMGKD